MIQHLLLLICRSLFFLRVPSPKQLQLPGLTKRPNKSPLASPPPQYTWQPLWGPKTPPAPTLLRVRHSLIFVIKLPTVNFIHRLAHYHNNEYGTLLTRTYGSMGPSIFLFILNWFYWFCYLCYLQNHQTVIVSKPVEFHRRSSFEKYVAEAAAKSSSHLQNRSNCIYLGGFLGLFQSLIKGEIECVISFFPICSNFSSFG